VARIGGDEFTVLLDAVANADDARLVAERVESALEATFVVDGHELRVTASIGIALSTPALSEAELLRNADIAMYDAKRRGGGRWALFDQSMHKRVVNRVERENDLRQAVEQSRIGVHFQPIVELGTGRLYGIEALARWPYATSKVAPLEFITIAEETGMIGVLGLQVLTTALDAVASWRASGLLAADVCISVNVSPRQLDDPELPDMIVRALSAAGLPAEALRLEITESTLMQEPVRVGRIISELHATGVRLHLDDFGTGYSSLSALYQFPVEALKIDRSFIASMTGRDSDAIVRSIVALAHSLGLDVIAEGIERPDQLEQLVTLGCEYGQGFLFSRPLGFADLEGLLTRWAPSADAQAAR
jgi:predicted signal transduction protein with EAL and GGDEF domain